MQAMSTHHGNDPAGVSVGPGTPQGFPVQLLGRQVIMEDTKPSRNLCSILVVSSIFQIYKELTKGRQGDLEGSALCSVIWRQEQAWDGDEWSQSPWERISSLRNNNRGQAMRSRLSLNS